MSRSSALLVALASLLLTAQASADLPPPDGTKFVGYRFTVKGFPAGQDRVLFAYPCSSGGMFVAAQQKLDDGVPVTVGRRGGRCAIYSIAKRDYEAFLASYKPTESTNDPALEAFAKRATACQGGPTLVHSLPSSDPRDTVHELLTVKTLTATACVLATQAGAPTTAPPPSASTPSPAATPPATAPTTAPATPAPAPSSPRKSSSCATAPRGVASAGGDALFPALMGVAFVASAARRRRRCAPAQARVR